MYIEIPTGFTFSDLRTGVEPWLTTFNLWLTKNGLPGTAVGAQNPLILKLNDFDLGGAHWVRSESMSDPARCQGIQNISHFPLTYVDLVVGIGGDIFEMPVFFEFDSEDDLDDEVPAKFPDRTYTELADPEDPESGVTKTHTWRTWYPRHEPKEHGGKWYKSSETNEKAIPASCWADERASGALTVKTVAEYREISNKSGA